MIVWYDDIAGSGPFKGTAPVPGAGAALCLARLIMGGSVRVVILRISEDRYIGVLTVAHPIKDLSALMPI